MRCEGAKPSLSSNDQLQAPDTKGDLKKRRKENIFDVRKVIFKLYKIFLEGDSLRNT